MQNGLVGCAMQVMENNLDRLSQRAVVGELSQGIFHELNNHLQIILGLIQSICHEKDQPQENEEIEIAVNEVQQCCELVKHVHFIESATNKESYEDLAIILQHVMPLLQYKLRKKQVQAHLLLAADLDFIQGEMLKIRSAIAIVLLGAAERSKERSDLGITARNIPDKVVLEVKFQAHPEANSVPMEELWEILEGICTTTVDKNCTVCTLYLPSAHAT